jgi:hypothetical protein
VDSKLPQDFSTNIPNADDFQIGLSPGNFSDIKPEAFIWVPQEAQAEASEIKVAAEKTMDGYALEVSLPWKIFGMDPKKDRVFGLVLTVSDTDSDVPQQETMISTCKNSPSHWGDTRFFNNAYLER